MKQLALSLLTLALLFTACKKESRTDDSNGNSPGTPIGALNEPGYGPSTAAFKAPAWKLPDGVELTDNLHEMTYCLTGTPPRFEEFKNFRGLPGGMGHLCFTLRNKTNNTITVDIPDGLVVVSGSVANQNLLLLFTGSVTLPPGGVKNIFVGGFCINHSRNVPEPYDDNGNPITYTFGPSDIPAALKEIKDILKTKNLSYQSVVKTDGTFDVNKMAKLSVIQDAIWEVTDEGGLTDETRNALKDLTL